MENLHIPLHSHHSQTTRRTRRVVWQQALPLVILLLIAGSFGRMWFEKNTLTRATPEGAVAHLHFTPTKKGWRLLDKHFGDIPLISGTPITIKDIQPFTKGEFSVFLLPEGKRVLAVRAKKENLPTSLFDSLGIIVQSTKDDRHLLSTQPMAVQQKSVSKPWFAYFPRVQPLLGSVHIFGDDSKNGILTAPTTNIIIKMNKGPTWPALSKTLLSKDLIAAVTLEPTTRLSGFGTEPSVIMVGEGILMEFGEDTATKEVETVFDRLVSAQNLRLAPHPLPDSTFSQEIILDVPLTNKEQVFLNGYRLTRAQTKTGAIFLAEKKWETAISNNQKMMEAWLDAAHDKNTSSCDSRHVVASLDKIAQKEAALSNAYSNLMSSHTFDFACISKGLYSTNIVFFPEHNP